MKLPERLTWAAIFLLVLAALPASCLAATTTIDFETPDLGTNDYQAMSTYVVDGVTFSSYPSVTGLAREEYLMGTCGNPSNQTFGSVSARTISYPITVNFPPAADASVTFVSFDALAYRYTSVEITLFNAADQVVASGSGVANDALGACETVLWGARVLAVSPEPVSYALITIDIGGTGYDCIASCCDGSVCLPFMIDNFRFGDCIDAEAPSLSVSLSPAVLWPPNHRLVAVRASVQAEDDCDDSPQVRLISITSDEPDEGTTAGDLPGDIQGADTGLTDLAFNLRSERGDEGDGRVYTVCYEARDEEGNRTEECAQVRVPHHRSGRAVLAAGVWPGADRGKASLAYSIPAPGNVQLRIFDVAGRLVTVLVDDWRPAGRHVVRFVPEKQGSGIYFYRLDWGVERTSGKFAVLK